ncbi:MAG: NAD(+) synthase [Clostridia bacterium]|nr:NAD(+) synthase [Clostridiales bacterium]
MNSRIEKTVEWLSDKVSKTKTRGLAVGISGGIDSAVVAFLIKKALPENSLGIVLPCNSSSQDMTDAASVIEACGIDSIEIDLTSIHRDLVGKIFEKRADLKRTGEDNLKIARANLKARLRMSTLYTVANGLNYLVAGTDNAAETYVGYFTKYGDGGVDLQPIAHITKREVREWAKILGVPDKVIKKVPTAGLWEGQTDEGEMGTTYDMVDDLLEGKSIPERDRLIIERLHRVSEHKRNIPPSPPREWYI